MPARSMLVGTVSLWFILVGAGSAGAQPSPRTGESTGSSRPSASQRRPIPKPTTANSRPARAPARPSRRPDKAKTPPARQVVVFSFHRTVRCVSCIKIEAWTEEAVKESFARELKDGRLQLFSINTDDAGNEHFVKEYKLSGPTVVLSDTTKGKETRWKGLDKAWSLVQDETAFRKYVADEVRAYLGKQ